jgi:hypothetical protein
MKTANHREVTRTKIWRSHCDDVTRQSRRRRRGSSTAIALSRTDAPIVSRLVSAKREAGAFTGQQVVLLKTFADQAVIAIENVMKVPSATGTGWEPTPWHATQRAALEALKKITEAGTGALPQEW